jgi:hypothetical protein
MANKLDVPAILVVRSNKVKTYTLNVSSDGTSITCLRCKMTSYHPMDVKNRYCAKCKVFHKDED